MLGRLLLALLLVLAAGPGARAEAPPGPLRLEVDPAFAFGNLTLLSGHLTFGEPRLDTPRLVGAEELVLGEGVLDVCRLIVHRNDPLSPETSRTRCIERASRMGTFQGPLNVSFGLRTQVMLRGEYGVTRFPAASVGTFVATNASAGNVWAALLSEDGVGLEPPGDSFVFFTYGSAASASILDGDERVDFNGSQFIFTFTPSGPDHGFSARAHALRAGVAPNLTLALAPGPRGAFAPDAFRTLLDLQADVLGPDRREPLANLSALLADHSRVPTLLDAALLGHLQGEVLGVPFAHHQVSFVRLRALEGTFGNGTLEGTAAVTFTSRDHGFAPGGVPLSSDPVWLIAGAWAAALALLVLLRAPDAPPRLDRTVRLLCFLAGLAAWDLAVGGALGASAVSLARAGAPFVEVATLAAFELVAYVLAWVALAVPARLALQRLLWRTFGRGHGLAAPLATAAFVAFLLVSPFSLLALGSRLARL